MIGDLKERLRSMRWCVTADNKGVGRSDDTIASEALTRIEQLEQSLQALEARIAKADALADELVSSVATHTKDGKPHHPAHSRLFQKLAAYRADQ